MHSGVAQLQCRKLETLSNNTPYLNEPLCGNTMGHCISTDTITAQNVNFSENPSSQDFFVQVQLSFPGNCIASKIEFCSEFVSRLKM